MSTSYGVLGEGTDPKAIKRLIRRLLDNERLPIRVKGYAGCGELRKKARLQIEAWAKQGIDCFVVCHDADGPDSAATIDAIKRANTVPQELRESCCIVVPIQEFEAWLIADANAVNRVLKNLDLREIREPHRKESPKDFLRRRSQTKKTSPQYSHVVHNERIAEILDLNVVELKCESFHQMAEFLRNSKK
jgi:hypothetical protein